MADREIKPIWNSATFLVYTGGLTVLGGAAAGLAYLASKYNGYGAMALWSLLFLVVIYGIANALLMRDRPTAAGIFAWVSVILWAVFLIYLFLWFGWHGFTGDISQWSWSRLLLWILILLATWYDRRRFRFPFIRLISAVVFWLFVVDLLTSGSGDWFAIVTLVLGVFYLLLGNVIDKPSAFWLHVVGGALIGVALLKWFNTSDTDFAFISFFALVYVVIAYSTKRSSWAFFATIGFFAATIHYLVGSPTAIVQSIVGVSHVCSGLGPRPACTAIGPHLDISPWSPALAFGLLGFWLVALGLLGRRQKGHAPAPVVVQTEPAAEIINPPAE